MTTAPFSPSRGLLQRLFDWKVRGVRWVEIIGVALVAVMIVSVYAAKAAAARESARIAELERDIRENGPFTIQKDVMRVVHHLATPV